MYVYTLRLSVHKLFTTKLKEDFMFMEVVFSDLVIIALLEEMSTYEFSRQ